MKGLSVGLPFEQDLGTLLWFPLHSQALMASVKDKTPRLKQFALTAHVQALRELANVFIFSPLPHTLVNRQETQVEVGSK